MQHTGLIILAFHRIALAHAEGAVVSKGAGIPIVAGLVIEYGDAIP